MKVRKRKKKGNPVAKDLRTPKYKLRVERKRKGKGSYDRNKENSDVQRTETAED